MSFRRPLVLVAALAALAPGTAAARTSASSRATCRWRARRLGRAAGAAQLHHGRHPLAGLRRGLVPDGGAAGPVRAVAAGSAGGRGHAGRRQRRARRARRLADRQPLVDGPARWIQYRVSGEVTRLRTYFVDSPVTAADRARAASTRTAAAAAAARAGPVAQPSIVRRAGWNADETIVRDAPAIAQRAPLRGRAPHRGLEQLLGGRVGGDRPRDPALPRARERLGRHRLQLPRRQVRPGLRGPRRRDHENVVGAHAGGFNTGSVGVAVIGIYDSASLSTGGRRALQRLLAWRLDVGHVHPRGRWDAVSGGSSRWPVGANGPPARGLRPPGHEPDELSRATGSTACSGRSRAG